MNLSTPHLIYIIAAYGMSLVGLAVFLGVTLYQWKQSKQLMFHYLEKIK